MTNIYIFHIAIFFPKLLSSGQLEEKNLNFIVMQKFDIDLERIFLQHKKKFKLDTIVTIGLLALERLETMH